MRRGDERMKAFARGEGPALFVKGEAGPLHLGEWEEDEEKNRRRDAKRRQRSEEEQKRRAAAEQLGVQKSTDRKSTMFEYGTKEQQEAEIAKPRALPPLASKKERRPKRLRESGIKEPVLSGEAKMKWEEAKRQAAVKAVEAILNKAKRRGKPISSVELAKKTAPQAVLSRIERKARLQKPKPKHAPVAKAEVEEKHYGTRHGTKDPKGSLKRISRYKTKSGKIKSPPDSPKGRKEMASEMIAHHHHHLGRHPGGRAQAIAIGLRQAGMSREQARKAMGNEIIRESAEARLGEIFGAELNLSPVDLMKSMTLMSDAGIMRSVGEINKAMGEGDAVKAYMGFEKLKREIAGRGGVDNPAAVAAKIGMDKYGKEAMQEMAHRGEKAPEYKKRKRKEKGKGKVEKGDPGGMSGYEKGVAMYGKEGMKAMAQQHLTSGELQQTKKATPLPLPVGKAARLVPEPAAKALGKQGEEEEYVPKDKPDISKQIGPSVGPGITGPSGAKPSVGMGKSKGDEKKAYLGEFKPGSGFTGSGAAPAGYKPGSGQAVGEEAAEKMSPSSEPHERPGFKPPAISTPKPPPSPHEVHVGTSGGFTSKTPAGGPHIFTSAKPVPGEEAEPSMKPGSTLTLTSLKAPGSKSVRARKSMDDLLSMSKAVHGGKGPAKTGGGQWNCPNAGPAHRGGIDWDEEENQAGSGRAKTGAGTPHPPNAGPARTGAGQVEFPNAGPAKTGPGERHSPGREMGKAVWITDEMIKGGQSEAHMIAAKKFGLHPAKGDPALGKPVKDASPDAEHSTELFDPIDVHHHAVAYGHHAENYKAFSEKPRHPKMGVGGIYRAGERRKVAEASKKLMEHHAKMLEHHYGIAPPTEEQYQNYMDFAGEYGHAHHSGNRMHKAMMASSIPRMPRAMAASLDTWRSATSVLTRTNAMLQPQAPLTPDPLADAGGRPSTHTEFYKSDLMRCENCGRAFAKSHGECPTCSMSKALTCKSCGASMHKGRDGELKCSACGQGIMKAKKEEPKKPESSGDDPWYINPKGGPLAGEPVGPRGLKKEKPESPYGKSAALQKYDIGPNG